MLGSVKLDTFLVGYMYFVKEELCGQKGLVFISYDNRFICTLYWNRYPYIKGIEDLVNDMIHVKKIYINMYNIGIKYTMKFVKEWNMP